MKKGLYIFLFFTVALSVCCKHPKTHGLAKHKPTTGWEKENLKGKVKNMALKSYYATDSGGKLIKLHMDGNFNDSVVFDSKGNKTASYSFNSNGYLLLALKYTYDSAGHELTCNKYDLHEKLYQSSLSTYDSKWDKIKEVEFDSSGNINEDEDDKYDGRGNNTEMVIHLHNEPHNISKFVYTYDGNDNPVEWIHTYDGKFQYTWKYFYDKNNNRIRQNSYDSLDKINFHEESTYDENGNKLSVKDFNADNKVTDSIVFRIDDRGRTVQKYDSGWGYALIVKWEYDSTGNWVRSVVYKNTDILGNPSKEWRPTEITERKFEYYK